MPFLILSHFVCTMVEITLVQGELKMGERAMNYHSSEIIDLHLTKCSSKTLNNLLYFMYWKTHSVFLFGATFNLCFHRPGHSLGEK